MKIIRTVAHTIIAYIFIGILCCIFFPICFVISCLPERWRRDNPVYFWSVYILMRAVVWASFLPIKYEGLENIPREPAIFAPNHLSSFDIPVVSTVIGPRTHVWLFLSRFAHVPFVGFVFRRMNVMVDVSTPQTMLYSLKSGIKLVKGTDRSLVMFPEGGRAVDGNLQPFFPGVAVIAQTTNLPIVPIFLHNLDKAYPIGSFLLRQYPITVRVGKPFYVQEGQDRDQFLNRVYQWFLEQAKQ